MHVHLCARDYMHVRARMSALHVCACVVGVHVTVCACVCVYVHVTVYTCARACVLSARVSEYVCVRECVCVSRGTPSTVSRSARQPPPSHAPHLAPQA